MNASARSIFVSTNVLAARVWYAALYTAAVLAGYAAGIILLLRRAGAASGLREKISHGVVGVEQLNWAQHSEWGHTGSRPLGAGASSYWPGQFEDPGEWFVLSAGMWLAVFTSMGLLCWASTRIAPRRIRSAAAGHDGALVAKIWRSTLQESISVLRAPTILSAAFLAGLAVVIVCDIVCLQGRTLSGRLFTGELVLPVESLPLLCIATVVPIVLVRIRASRRARRDPELARRWCGRCGHSLNMNMAEPTESPRCPECGWRCPTSADERPHRQRLALMIVAGLGGLAFLLWAHLRTREISALVDSVMYGAAAFDTVDRITVKPGCVVRVERPDGIIWFRAERLGPPSPWNWRGPGDRPHPDARLRIVVEMKNASQTEGGGASTEREAKRSHFSAVLEDQSKPRAKWDAPITVARDGGGVPIVVEPQWSSGQDYVFIYLTPIGATSIQSVDPATAPSFDDE